jgi:hypothetical protein
MAAMRNTTPAMAGVGGDPAVGSGDCAGTRAYYASIGPRRGPLIYNEALLAIRVTRTWRGRGPVGAALCVGRDEAGLALWELTVGKIEVSGRWVVIDREFRPVQDCGRGRCRVRGDERGRGIERGSA